MYGDDRRGDHRRGNGNRGSHGRGSNGRSFSDDLRPMSYNEDSVPFQKNFYTPTNTLDEMEASQLREQSQMRLMGKDIPMPVKDFDSLRFSQKVVDHFISKGYSKPTPIQAQGWPMALSGRDMVGIAETGSGKTISFVLPALVHAKAQEPLRENDGPVVLILAPTRELCTQIEGVVSEYKGYFGLNSLAVYGGASIVPQKKAMLRGVEILVATPGRLIDLNEQGFCPLNRVSFLVLDEADRMLDMGFEPQLNKIIPRTNKDRQTLMWSATWPREVRSLANNYMKDYIQVTIGDDSLKGNIKISQNVEILNEREKNDRLLELLKNTDGDKIIVFCNQKRTCDRLEDLLYDSRLNAASLHGDKTQAARDTVINAFKVGRKNILIATDVAARGLDVENVKMVINYDFPRNIEDYVHRIGRTARGNSSEGLAYSFFTREDSGNARKFVEILKQTNQIVPDELSNMASRGGNYSGSSRYRSTFKSRSTDRRYGY